LSELAPPALWTQHVWFADTVRLDTSVIVGVLVVARATAAVDAADLVPRFHSGRVDPLSGEPGRLFGRLELPAASNH
jgi:hypothetical protein